VKTYSGLVVVSVEQCRIMDSGVLCCVVSVSVGRFGEQQCAVQSWHGWWAVCEKGDGVPSVLMRMEGCMFV
jgi:hypothetical protein